jgi:beta-N-acetylhexosaminidase
VSVTRVLRAKTEAGLYEERRWPAPDLGANGRTAMELARQTITVLKNDGVLPLRGNVYAIAKSDADLSTVPGDSDLASELRALRPNTTARKFTQPTEELIASAVDEARSADTIVVGVADAATSEGQRRLVAALAALKPTVLVSLRSPYDALYVAGVKAIVCTYGARVPTLRATAEVLTGAQKAVGRLPVDIPGRYAIGAGL